MVRLQLGYLGALHLLDTVRVDDLPHPLLLGCDVPEFRRLLAYQPAEESL